MKRRNFDNFCILAVCLATFFFPPTVTAQTTGPDQTLATPETFVNTGSGGTVGGESVSGNLPTQWVAAQFTLTQPAAITKVEGWFGPTGAGGSINVAIRINDATNPSSPVPGVSIWSQPFTVPAQTTANWVTFSNFIPVLAPGTYWLSFEPPTTSTLKTAMYGPSPSPLANYAFYVPSNGHWLNFNFAGASTTYPGIIITGLNLTTSSGDGVVTFGSAARTVTQGTIFNMFPFSQFLPAVGDVGQSHTLQWNIYGGAASASADGVISANPSSPGNILTAGAYSATGTASSGAARGVAFATYVNLTGQAIPYVNVNAALNGAIYGASASSPVQVAAAVYVFDTAQFTTVLNNAAANGQTAAQFLLGGPGSLLPGGGADLLPDLSVLFPSGSLVDTSVSSSSFPLICTSSCSGPYQVATSGFYLPANGVFTVMFDVSAASQGAASAQSLGIGNFLDTLMPDLTNGFFQDASGNPIAGIAGPVAVILPPSPASIALSPAIANAQIGGSATVTAAVTDVTGAPIPNAVVRFSINSGPHSGYGAPAGIPVGTDANGNATFTLTDTLGQTGTDSFTAAIGALQSTSPAQVTWTSPGPLYALTLGPPTTSIALGAGQAYTASGLDFFGNSTAIGTITYGIMPDGSCTGALCTPAATGTHTVTGTGSNPVVGNVTATATLNVSGTIPMLTITASSATMTYGGTVPTITASYTYGSVVNSATPPGGLTTPPTCSTTATSNSPVGSYPSTCSGAVDANYTISYAPGSVTVSAAPLTITASGGTLTYGGTIPTITASYTYGSVVNSATPPSGLTTPPTCSTTATSNSPAGTYPTTCSGAVDSNYTIAYVAGVLTITTPTGKTNPVITWPTPAPVTYGTPLSGSQLDATANVPGTFTYNPPARTLLSAGAHTLSATFTPTNTSAYNIVTATVTLQVNQATPVVLWVPIPIVYGTPLGPLQLDALPSVPGKFTYTPAAGTVLHAGNQPLSATFTPNDATDYKTITVSATLIVLKALPQIQWAQPAAITVGTPLGALQLDAKSNLPGTFVYNPPAGTVPPQGTDVLSATFTPTDTANYQTDSAKVSLTVTPKK